MVDRIKIRRKYDRLLVHVVFGYMDDFFRILAEYERKEMQTSTISGLRRDLSISAYTFELTLPHNDYAPIVDYFSNQKRVFIYGKN